MTKIYNKVLKTLDRKHRLNIILTFVIPLTVFIVGLIGTFFFLDASFTVEQIIDLPYYWGIPDETLRQQLIESLGLNDPLVFRFLRYLSEFFSGSWSFSLRVDRGTPVSEILKTSVPPTIELLIIPLIVGIFLGYVVGSVSNRTKHNWLKKSIQILSVLGIAVPIFIFSIFLQFTLGYLIPIFPLHDYKTYNMPSPPLITGFRILDSLLSGNMNLAIDILYHYSLPLIILTVAITALMTRVFSSRMVEDSYKKKSILSNTAKASVVFGVILMYLVMVDETFYLSGLGVYFVRALYSSDYFLIRGFLLMFVILYVITIFISNLSFSLNGIRKDKHHPLKDFEEAVEREPNLSPKIEIKDYLKKIMRSPLTIIGLIAVFIPIFIALFPELVSGHTFEEATGIFYNQWGPPTPENPLGQTYFGRDVLTLIAFGTRDSLIFAFSAVFIGLIEGLIFGVLASIYNRTAHTIIMSITLIFYVVPGMLLVLFFSGIAEYRLGFLVISTGLLLTPGFTRIIANTEFRIVPMTKKIISYVPLFAGFAIMFYASLGFLGFSDPRTIQLGDLVRDARVHLTDAPWASIWPSLTVILIVTSLFVLHEGLVKHSR